jgi:glucose/arabinose dehydrogenase
MRKLEQDFEERGLLGFALHPDFAKNGRVYVSYAAPLRQGAPQNWNHTRRISEFSTAPGDLSKVVPESERVLIELDWPSRKHNGGALAFGPDGFLYVGLGDGGVSHGVGEKLQWEAFDVPAAALSWDHLAQDTQSLFGKILRLDVDRGFPGYAVPGTTPSSPGLRLGLGNRKSGLQGSAIRSAWHSTGQTVLSTSRRWQRRCGNRRIAWRVRATSAGRCWKARIVSTG